MYARHLRGQGVTPVSGVTEPETGMGLPEGSGWGIFERSPSVTLVGPRGGRRPRRRAPGRRSRRRRERIRSDKTVDRPTEVVGRRDPHTSAMYGVPTTPVLYDF